MVSGYLVNGGIMNKKYKLFLLLCSLIFITGCNIDYNLTIDSKQRIKETSVITEDNDILKVYNDSLEVVPEQTFYQYKSLTGFKYYKLDQKIFNEDSTGAKLIANFDNFDEYKESLLFGRLFDNLSINEYGNMLSVVASGYHQDFFASEEDENFNVKQINVNIKFHNKVTDNNADEYDEKENTYTWILKANDNKSISFSIDKNEKRYDIIIKDFLTNNLITIIVTISIILLILIIATYFSIKNKHANKI